MPKPKPESTEPRWQIMKISQTAHRPENSSKQPENPYIHVFANKHTKQNNHRYL